MFAERCFSGIVHNITLNTNTPTRVPNTTLQQTSSPYITTVSNTPYNRTHYHQTTTTFTNYKKAVSTQFTENTESVFAQTTIPTNIHTANRIFTNIILMTDKHNIPKGKMHRNCRLLPEDIVCKITQRNNTRRANTRDPVLKLLNEEIISDIQKHKQNIWKEHLDAHWDHRHNTHILWKTIHGLSNRAPPSTQLHHIQQQNNKPTQTYCTLFHQTIQLESCYRPRFQAPNDTAYKRWNCHSGHKLQCKLCRTTPPPAMGARFAVFWACRPCGPAGWLALLLTKAGDVETNPGPTTLNKSLDL